MNKMFARVVLCVLALSLTSLAADKTLVTTKPIKGGHPADMRLLLAPAGATFINNLDTAYPKGLYFCCSGNIIAGPNNPDGFPAYAEAVQFTLASASHVRRLVTNVNYISPGKDTQFELNIEADSSGVPSGTPINKAPYKITVGSQSFGKCCEVEARYLGKVGLSLSAGTYWVVWQSISSTSDLAAEVNVSIRDQVDAVNVAYSQSNGAAGSWTGYATVTPFVIEITGTTP